MCRNTSTTAKRNSPMIEEQREELANKYWTWVEKAFKGYLGDLPTIPCATMRNECLNIYVRDLAPLLYPKLVRHARHEILRAGVDLHVAKILEHFKRLRRNMDCFYNDASLLTMEGNRAVRSSSLKPYSNVFRHAVYAAMRKKLRRISEVLSAEIVKIIASDRECRGSPRLVTRGLRLFMRYKLFPLVLDGLVHKLIDVYSEECSDTDLDERVYKIYKLMSRERDNKYLKYVFKTVENRFLTSILDRDLEVFFQLKRDRTSSYLIELYVRAYGMDGFCQKLEQFAGKYKLANFTDLNLVLRRLSVFRCRTPEAAVVEKIDSLVSRIVTENEDLVIFDGIDTVSDAYLGAENTLGSAGAYKADRKGAVDSHKELNASLAQVLRFATRKEDFDTHLRRRVADFLLRNELSIAKDFVSHAKAAKIASTHIHRIEVMCEEAETRLMASTSEILYVRSCYWPSYEDWGVKIPELEDIKKKFIKEEKRKNPRVVIRFVDSVSLCEIELCGHPLVVTAIQYKILDLLVSGRKRRAYLEETLSFRAFSDHYDPLVRSGVVAEVSGNVVITYGGMQTRCLPTVFNKRDENVGLKPDTMNAEAERKGNMLDSEIMNALKREKRAKEAVLCRRLKSRLDFFTVRIGMLVEKGYLRREGNDLVYVP